VARDIVWFQKTSIPTPRWGISKAKIFHGTYEPNLESPEGWRRGFQTKKPWMEQHIVTTLGWDVPSMPSQ